MQFLEIKDFHQTFIDYQTKGFESLDIHSSY